MAQTTEALVLLVDARPMKQGSQEAIQASEQMGAAFRKAARDSSEVDTAIKRAGDSATVVGGKFRTAVGGIAQISGSAALLRDLDFSSANAARSALQLAAGVTSVAEAGTVLKTAFLGSPIGLLIGILSAGAALWSVFGGAAKKAGEDVAESSAQIARARKELEEFAQLQASINRARERGDASGIAAGLNRQIEGLVARSIAARVELEKARQEAEAPNFYGVRGQPDAFSRAGKVFAAQAAVDEIEAEIVALEKQRDEVLRSAKAREDAAASLRAYNEELQRSGELLIQEASRRAASGRDTVRALIADSFSAKRVAEVGQTQAKIEDVYIRFAALEKEVGRSLKDERDEVVRNIRATEELEAAKKSFNEILAEQIANQKKLEEQQRSARSAAEGLLGGLQFDLGLVGASDGARRRATALRQFDAIAGPLPADEAARFRSEIEKAVDALNAAEAASTSLDGRLSALFTKERFQGFADTIGQTIGQAIEDLVFETGTLEDALKSLERIAFNFFVTQPLQTLLSGGIGSLFSARGNLFRGGTMVPVERYDLGGILDRLTTFPLNGGSQQGIAGEAGFEGLFPVTRDSRGRLAVQAVGGNNSTTNVVNVNVFGVRDPNDFGRSRRQLERLARAGRGGIN